MSELSPSVTVDGRRSWSRLQTVNDDFSFLALNFFHISPLGSVIILNIKKKKKGKYKEKQLGEEGSRFLGPIFFVVLVSKG